MLSELKKSPRVVGVKQLRRALSRGTVQEVFLARDADPALTEPVENLAQAAGISVAWVRSMKELGQACGISVGASAAGLLREA